MNHFEYVALIASPDSAYDNDIYTNTWLFSVPIIRKEIAELDKVIDILSEKFGNQVITVIDLKNQKEIYINLIETLRSKYSEPVVNYFDDKIEYDASWQQLFNEVPFSQGLPQKPLTLINSMSHGTLLYRDDENKIYKVPNIWYNQPSKRVYLT